MKTETIVMCVVALLLGMLLANMLKSVCGCKVVEALSDECKDCRKFKTGDDWVASGYYTCLDQNDCYNLL